MPPKSSVVNLNDSFLLPLQITTIMPELEYASETDWFAVDARGNMALLASSFGPIPAELAWRGDLASDMARALLNLPANSGIISHFSGLGRPDLTDLASRGLFAFAWSDYHGPYLKVLAPLESMHLSLLLPLHGVGRLPRLPSIRFDTTDRISQLDIQDYEWINWPGTT